MRDDVCVNCNQRIYLVKSGPNLFRWVSDPEKPEETSRCPFDTLGPNPKVEHAVLPRPHAPASMRESHR